MIEFRNVTKSYGDFTAVEDISFSACDSSVCGLIGYNGGQDNAYKMRRRAL